jgi:hypothetical protein
MHSKFVQNSANNLQKMISIINQCEIQKNAEIYADSKFVKMGSKNVTKNEEA